MEEPPMTRPKELLDRIAIERVVTQGVTPEGNASPEAQPTAIKVAPGVSAAPTPSAASGGQPAAPKDRSVVDGTPSRISGVTPFSGPPAAPLDRPVSVGAKADPRTGIPDVPVVAEVKPADVSAGRTVSPRVQEPFKVGETRVYAPETMAGRVATPKILDAIAGVPAAQREKQAFTGTAQVTPQTQVTVTVPPAFPYDPKELFAVVDSLINLPPRRDPTPRRNLSIPIDQTDLESTEAFVARSFTQNAGNTSDLDRWNL